MLNHGVAFGWWQGVPVWVVGIGLAVVGICAVKTRELWERVGLTMIGVGGAMNLGQRIRDGGVADPLQLMGVVYNNWADYLIFFGLLIYGYTYFVRRRKSSGHR